MLRNCQLIQDESLWQAVGSSYSEPLHPLGIRSSGVGVGGEAGAWGRVLARLLHFALLEFQFSLRVT